MLLSTYANRPARIANRMTDKALPPLRLLCAVRKPCCAGAPRMLRRGIFPAARGSGRSNRLTTAPGGNGHDRSATRVMSGMLAWYVHPWHAPWPAPGSVPILDLYALRNPSAYLLSKANRFLDARRTFSESQGAPPHEVALVDLLEGLLN